MCFSQCQPINSRSWVTMKRKRSSRKRIRNFLRFNWAPRVREEIPQTTKPKIYFYATLDRKLWNYSESHEQILDEEFMSCTTRRTNKKIPISKQINFFSCTVSSFPLIERFHNENPTHSISIFQRLFNCLQINLAPKKIRFALWATGVGLAFTSKKIVNNSLSRGW